MDELEKPLIVEGEPGCGKTEFARAVNELSVQTLYRDEVSMLLDEVCDPETLALGRNPRFIQSHLQTPLVKAQMPNNNFIERAITMLTVMLLKHVSQLKGGVDVSCADVAAYSSSRDLAEHEREFEVSNSEIVRTGLGIFKQLDERTRAKILRCVQISLAAEGGRVVRRDEIVTFTYLAGEHNQKNSASM